MYYLELLRVRRVAIFYAAALVAIGIFIAVGARLGNDVNISVNNTSPTGSQHTTITGIPAFDLPFGALVAAAALCGLGFATALAGSFNRETAYAHFTFVLPKTRLQMALAIAAIDIAGVLGASLFALCVAYATAVIGAGSKANIVFAGNDALVGVLGFGSAVAWYGVIQCATAWAPTRAGQWAGLCGAVMGLAIPLSGATFLPPLVWLCNAIMVVDPIAYFTRIQVQGGSYSIQAAIAGGMATHAIEVWILAAAALALSTTLWRRVEV